jgi:cell division septal protein FtsQ
MLAVLLLLVNAWLIYRFLSSPRFWVRELVVKGGGLVSKEEVRGVANVLNRSIFSVQASALEDRVDEQFGCIEDVSVHCELPSRVVFTLREREDMLVWKSGERAWWVDKEGNILGPTADPGDCLVVLDVEAWAPAPREHLIDVPWALAWDVAEALPAARSYEYVPHLGLVLRVTENNWPVYLGYGGDAEFKIAVMRELVQEFLEKGAPIKYIDVRNAWRPSYGKL